MNHIKNKCSLIIAILKYFCMFIALTPLFISIPVSSGTPIEESAITVDISTCTLIYDLLKEMKSNVSLVNASKKLDSILDSKPYTMMFKYYNRDFRPNHLPRDVFKRMILSLKFPGQYRIGENAGADIMLKLWKYYYNNLTLYKILLERLKKMRLEEIITGAVSEAKSWLPSEAEIAISYFFIHPNGGSNAFAISTAQGYDFFQLPATLDDLKGIIAHESHHTGLYNFNLKLNNRTDSLTFRFLVTFLDEGSATKLVDNAPGGRVPAVQKNKKSDSFNKEAIALWKKYTDSEEDIFKRMLQTFERAYSGTITNDELDKEITTYWLNGIKGPAYFIGSELMGAVYHGFGKEGCFAVMRDPGMMFDLYNKAIKRENQLLSGCIIIPETSVKHALSIGR